jgi:hypothetical protein
MDYARQEVDKYGPFKVVVEIGGRNINGTVRDLFGECDYTTTDILPGEGVDVVVDGADYVPDLPPNCVICTEVLEHAANARDIMRNMVTMLAPGGVAIMTCAGPGRGPHSAIDGNNLKPGEHYANVSCEEIHEWLEDMDVTVYTDTLGADTRATVVKR